MADEVAKIRAVQDEGLALFERKNADYGDAYKTYGPVGILVRIGDKISRLATVTHSEVRFVSTEPLRDTLVDLHNYAAMAIAELDEKRDVVSIEETPLLTRPRHRLPSKREDLPPLGNIRTQRAARDAARSGSRPRRPITSEVDRLHII